eukprot:1195853-Prorocentrum_minimum.AAC.4
MPSLPHKRGHGTGACVHCRRWSCMVYFCTSCPQCSQFTLRKSHTAWWSSSSSRFTSSGQPLKGHATCRCSHSRACLCRSSSRPAQSHPTSSAPQNTCTNTGWDEMRWGAFPGEHRTAPFVTSAAMMSTAGFAENRPGHARFLGFHEEGFTKGGFTKRVSRRRRCAHF